MQRRLVQLTTLVSELRTLALAHPILAPADFRRLQEAHDLLGLIIADLEVESPGFATDPVETANGEPRL